MKDSFSNDRFPTRHARLARLEPQRGQNEAGTGEENTQHNRQAPDGFGLEAVGPSATSPIPQAERAAVLAEVARERLRELRSGLRVRGCARIVNDHAVEKGQRLAEDDGDDDEGQQQGGVGPGHDEEPEIGLRVEEGYAD